MKRRAAACCKNSETNWQGSLEESRKILGKRQVEEILKQSVATGEGSQHHASFMEEDEDPELQAALALSIEEAKGTDGKSSLPIYGVHNDVVHYQQSME